MKVRHAAAVAGLALGLMSGVADAASFTYDVSFGQGYGNQLGPIVTTTVIGTITTNKDAGVLMQDNITAFDLTTTYTDSSGTYSQSFDNVSGSLNLNGSDLAAKGQDIVFTFNNDQGGFLFNSGDSAARFDAYAGFNGQSPTAEIRAQGKRYTQNDSIGSSIDIAKDSSISLVPLPASAPMFGGALMALGAVGYGLKRKAKAAATA